MKGQSIQDAGSQQRPAGPAGEADALCVCFLPGSIYEVSSILGKYQAADGSTSYRVQWVGFPKTTVEPAANLLATAGVLIQAFEARLAAETEATRPKKSQPKVAPAAVGKRKASKRKEEPAEEEEEARPRKKPSSSTTSSGGKRQRKQTEAFSPLRQSRARMSESAEMRLRVVWLGLFRVVRALTPRLLLVLPPFLAGRQVTRRSRPFATRRSSRSCSRRKRTRKTTQRRCARTHAQAAAAATWSLPHVYLMRLPMVCPIRVAVVVCRSGSCSVSVASARVR